MINIKSILNLKVVFFFQNMFVGCSIYDGSLTHKDCSRTRTTSFMPGPRMTSSPQLGILYLPTRHLMPSFQLGRLVRPDGEMRIPARPAWQGKQQNLVKLQKSNPVFFSRMWCSKRDALRTNQVSKNCPPQNVPTQTQTFSTFSDALPLLPGRACPPGHQEFNRIHRASILQDSVLSLYLMPILQLQLQLHEIIWSGCSQRAGTISTMLQLKSGRDTYWTVWVLERWIPSRCGSCLKSI